MSQCRPPPKLSLKNFTKSLALTKRQMLPIHLPSCKWNSSLISKMVDIRNRQLLLELNWNHKQTTTSLRICRRPNRPNTDLWSSRSRWIRNTVSVLCKSNLVTSYKRVELPKNSMQVLIRHASNSSNIRKFRLSNCKRKLKQQVWLTINSPKRIQHRAS